MGAANANAVYRSWGHLKHYQHRLLVHMALVSLDNESDDGRPARRYFAGAGALALALGYSAPGVAMPTAGQRRAAMNVLYELRDAGAVRQTRRGGFGRTAEWEVVTDPPFAEPRGSPTTTGDGPPPASRTTNRTTRNDKE